MGRKLSNTQTTQGICALRLLRFFKCDNGAHIQQLDVAFQASSYMSDICFLLNCDESCRHYYRCTHKTELGCPATKQVQQISDNPPKYKVIYRGHHTCKCPFRTPALYRDLNDDLDDSSILLSFEKPNKPKHGFSPFMLPLSWSSSTTSTAPMSNPLKNGIPLEPVDQHHGAHIQCPPSSDFVSTTSDLTTNTFVSDNVISLAEIYSSAVSPYDVEEDYSCMMTESFDFIDVFQDNYLLCA